MFLPLSLAHGDMVTVLDFVGLSVCNGFIDRNGNYIQRMPAVSYLAKLYLAIEVFILRS